MEPIKIISVAQFRPEKVGIFSDQGTHAYGIIHFMVHGTGEFQLRFRFLMKQAHLLQLEAFAAAIKILDADLPRPKLQFVGSCRNEADEKRLQYLKDRAKELKLDNDVEFHKNVTYRSAILSICMALFHFILGGVQMARLNLMIKYVSCLVHKIDPHNLILDE